MHQNGEKKCCKNTKLNKTSHVLFWIYHFAYSYHKHSQLQTPVEFFSAPKWRKNVVKILKLKKNTEINKTFHVLFWMYYFVYSYHKTIISNFFSVPKRRKCEIKMVIVWSKCRDMKNNISHLFSEMNIVFFLVCLFCFCFCFCFLFVLFCLFLFVCYILFVLFCFFFFFFCWL